MSETHPSHDRADRHPAVVQRAIGALVGGAVADALGAPYEFGPAGRFSAEFPDEIWGSTGEMRGGGVFGWAPGEFTDDTQMALVLAECILVNGELQLDDLFQRFRLWAATAADVGVSTSWALGHANRHEAAAAAANTGRASAGNGALMRVTPIALASLFAGTDDTMLAAVDQAGTTHHDPAAGWGAAIQAELLRRAILGADPLAELDEVIEHVSEPHRSRYASLLHPSFDPRATTEPHNGTVWTCLAQAIWANRVGRSFAEVVRAAIDLGGDTDTVATVAGALAGARFGPAGIPSRWSTYVHGSVTHPEGPRTYHLADLQEVARRLVGLAPIVDTPPEPAAGPTELAAGLFAANLSGAASVPHDWAVVSLCRPGSRFRDHPVRREMFLLDDHSNLDALAAVLDAVATIDAFLAEGRQVVVHCHGGRSRTALVTKAWAMRRYGFDEPAAHDWLAARWPLYQPYNEHFTQLLVSEAEAIRSGRRA